MLTTGAAGCDSRWSMSTLKSALPCVTSSVRTPCSVRFPSTSSRRAGVVSFKSNAFAIGSFSGLAAFNPMLSVDSGGIGLICLLNLMDFVVFCRLGFCVLT